MHPSLARLLAATALTFSSLALAENPPPIQWIRTFDGQWSARGYSVRQTADGGYIACGGASASNTSSEDAYVVKTDFVGNLEWQCYAGTSSAEEDARSLDFTSDGGYVFAGTKATLGPYWVFLVKVDSLGNVVWERVVSKDSSQQGHSVQRTTDGGFILGGVSPGAREDRGTYLAKTNSAGVKQWDRTFLQPYYGTEGATAARQTADGGFVIASRCSTGDLRLVKADGSGEETWQRAYATLDLGEAEDLKQTADGGFILTGGAVDDDDPDDPCAAYLLKTDTLGNVVWKKTYGGSDQDYGHSVVQMPDGGYLVAGETSSRGKPVDGYVFRTDSLGSLRWSRTIGGDAGHDDSWCAQPTSDGGFIVTGYMSAPSGYPSSLYLMKLGPEGLR